MTNRFYVVVFLLSFLVACSKDEAGPTTKTDVNVNQFRIPAQTDEYGKIGQCILGQVQLSAVIKESGYQVPSKEVSWTPLDLNEVKGSKCPQGTQTATVALFAPITSDLEINNINPDRPRGKVKTGSGLLSINCYGPCTEL